MGPVLHHRIEKAPHEVGIEKEGVYSMTRDEKETPGAATSGVTVELSGDPIFNKEEVLSLISGFGKGYRAVV